MTCYTLVVLLLFASVLCLCESLTIGLLMPEKEPYPGFPNIATSGGAVTLALKEAGRRYGPTVNISWLDTGCDEGLSIITAYDLGKNPDVEVIIGPACSKCLDLVVRLMSVIKPSTPIFTWLPRSRSNSHPNDTAISTAHSFDDITDALVITIKHFHWNKVAIISSRSELCVPLIETINDVFPNKDLNIMRLQYLDSYSAQDLRNALTNAKDHARIILVCLQSTFMSLLMSIADDVTMTTPEFVFLYCNFGMSPVSLVNNTWLTDKQTRVLSSVLQIGAQPLNKTTYDTFLTDAGNQTFPASTCCHDTDDFAASLYDTILYAVDLLNATTPRSNGSFDYTLLKRDVQSLSGLTHVTSDGKFSRPITLTYYQNGDFRSVAHVNGSYVGLAGIQWRGGSVPPDSPRCGWNGGQCEEDSSNSKNSAIIGSCVSLAVVLLLASIIYLCYRKSRFEKELMSMIWKVNKNEIKMRRPRVHTQNSIPNRDNNDNTHRKKKKLVRADTRGTLGLGSTTSLDKTLLFAPVGSYKGSIVALKNIKRRSIQLTSETLRDLNALRQLQHENLNPFIGVSLDPGNSFILMKYCTKGSLHDVLENDDIKLDHVFKMSFLMDLSRGLECLHKSVVKSHGNLKSTNCVIDSRWVLKLTDYGAVCIPPEEDNTTPTTDLDTYNDTDQYSKLLWTAPELLRIQRRPPKGTQKGDVYSFAIIVQEILLRCPPYYFNGAPSNQVIISRVRDLEDPPYRPRVTVEDESPDRIVTLMSYCWHEHPECRPDMHTVIKMLIEINGKRKTNIMDNMILMLEAYSNNLEELVANRTEELAREKQKTDTLLYQMLPPLVAEQLKKGEHVVPETFNEVSIFFSDIVGFTTLSSSSTPLQVIDLLNDLYTTFDEIIGMHDVYKVETIGDAYMVASGIPRRNGNKHSGEIANMALDLLSAVTNFRIRHMTGAKLQLRIGLHTGPCAAGVVGMTMPRYCLFGDTINMASRMESTGKALHIHVSTDFAEAIRGLEWGFQLLERGVIEVKGKGLQKTYWLIGKEGYSAVFPDEITRLKAKYEEIENTGRPSSPTDTNISNGSQGETSMYGSVFRRASNAIIFLRQISQMSKENSASGSKLTVRDIDTGDDDNGDNSDYSVSYQPIPQTNEPSNVLQLPKIMNKSGIVSDGHESSDSSTNHRKKKKKSKKKHKESKESTNSLQVPEIKIFP